MRKEYTNPIIEIENFNEENVITTSGILGNNNEPGYGDDSELLA